MKKISVIIPCYNVSPYIDRCMRSIVSQTIGMDSIEIICVDDASTDDTWEHLQKWEQLFPMDMIMIQQDVNKRQGAARNLGLKYASAAWVAFVDADDWLEPDYLERLYRPVDQYRCDVVCCGFIRDLSEQKDQPKGSDRKRGKEQYITADTKEIKQKLLRYKTLGPGAWAKIIRKDLLIKHEIFFPEGLVYEDHYWVPLLHIYVTNIYIIEEDMYHYFWNPCSTVLSREQEHHLDQLTIQMIKWREYGRRGFLQEYRDGLEYDLLWYAVTSFLKTILLFWGEPPFSYFRLGQEIIKQQIPDYRSNPYIDDLSEINRLLLEILYSTIDKDGFHKISIEMKRLLG